MKVMKKVKRKFAISSFMSVVNCGFKREFWILPVLKMTWQGSIQSCCHLFVTILCLFEQMVVLSFYTIIFIYKSLGGEVYNANH